MTQNNRNRTHITRTHDYGEQSNYALQRARANTKRKSGRYVRSQATAMALVLTIAFALSAVTAVVVSSFARNYTAAANTVPAISAEHKETAQNNGNNAQNTISYDDAQTAQPLGNVTDIFTAEGKTSTGYDWNYSGDSGCANINCQYDFNTNRYHFTAQGVYEGTDHVRLMYMTDDNTWATQSVTVSVDGNLNVTAA